MHQNGDENVQALVGARAVVVAGKVGPHLLAAAKAAGVEHVLLPSLAGTHLPGGSASASLTRGCQLRLLWWFLTWRAGHGGATIFS